MKLIVISDIFGKTPALIDLVNELADLYGEIAIINPYNNPTPQFETEQGAYQQFHKVCGQENLFKKALTEVQRSTSRVDILGFSVGGTCAWNLSSQSGCGQIRQCICFYGSRIREHTEATPQVPTTTIFPRFEVDFDIEPVIKTLSGKQNTEVIRTKYLHGFMNRKSRNFSEGAYQYFIPWLRDKAAWA